MIYLIAGCPLSGKTTLARALSIYSGIPFISTDDLSILFSYYTKFSLFANGNYYEYYETTSPETIRQDHLCYQQKMEEMLLHFLKAKLQQEGDLILEGFILSPNLLHALPSQDINILYLLMEENLLRARYAASNNFARKKEDRTVFDQKYLDKLFWLNRSNKVLCEKNQLPFLLVHNDDSMLFPTCEILNISQLVSA